MFPSTSLVGGIADLSQLVRDHTRPSPHLFGKASSQISCYEPSGETSVNLPVITCLQCRCRPRDQFFNHPSLHTRSEMVSLDVNDQHRGLRGPKAEERVLSPSVKPHASGPTKERNRCGHVRSCWCIEILPIFPMASPPAVSRPSLRGRHQLADASCLVATRGSMHRRSVLLCKTFRLVPALGSRSFDSVR